MNTPIAKWLFCEDCIDWHVVVNECPKCGDTQVYNYNPPNPEEVGYNTTVEIECDRCKHKLNVVPTL